jgi:Ser/Thr protein kinase RdoA (MazF antagonist)
VRQTELAPGISPWLLTQASAIGLACGQHPRLASAGAGTSARFIVRTEGSGNGPRRFLLKCYRENSADVDVGREFRALQALFSALDPEGPLRVPRPIAYDAALRSILLEFSPDPPLTRVLFRSVSGLPFPGRLSSSALRVLGIRVAAGLSTLQALPASALLPQPVLEHDVIIQRYRKTFDRRLQRLERAGADAGLLRNVAEWRHLLTLDGAHPDVVPQHSDFGYWNILVGDDWITAIDFHNFATGFVAYDAAFFLTALDLVTRFRAVSGARLSTVREAYVEGIDRQIRASGALFRALTLMHALYFAALSLEGSRSLRESLLLPVRSQRFTSRWIASMLDCRPAL